MSEAPIFGVFFVGSHDEGLVNEVENVKKNPKIESGKVWEALGGGLGAQVGLKIDFDGFLVPRGSQLGPMLEAKILTSC